MSRSTSVSTECTMPSLTSAISSSSTSSGSLSTPPSPSSRSKSPFFVVELDSEADSRSRGVRSARAIRSTDKLRSVLAEAFKTRIDLRTERGRRPVVVRRGPSLTVVRGGPTERREKHETKSFRSPLYRARAIDVLDMFTYDDDDAI